MIRQWHVPEGLIAAHELKRCPVSHLDSLKAGVWFHPRPPTPPITVHAKRPEMNAEPEVGRYTDDHKNKHRRGNPSGKRAVRCERPNDGRKDKQRTKSSTDQRCHEPLAAWPHLSMPMWNPPVDGAIDDRLDKSGNTMLQIRPPRPRCCDRAPRRQPHEYEAFPETLASSAILLQPELRDTFHPCHIQVRFIGNP